MTEQPKQVGGGRRSIGDIAPKLAALTDDVLFEDVWNRPGLGARDRSLITVAALVAGGDAEQLPLPPGSREGERGHGHGAHRGDHPPRVLRRLAEGDDGDHGREAARHGLTADAVLRRTGVPLRTSRDGACFDVSPVGADRWSLPAAAKVVSA